MGGCWTLTPRGIPPRYVDRALRDQGTRGQGQGGQMGRVSRQSRSQASCGDSSRCGAELAIPWAWGWGEAARDTPERPPPRSRGSRRPRLVPTAPSRRFFWPRWRPARSRPPSLLYPAVLAAGVFPSLPFPDVTESPPKLTPTSLPRSRSSKPNVGTAALKVWGLCGAAGRGEL